MATRLPGLRREDFHVAVICAVGCEYDAVIFAFDEIWDGLEFQLGNAPGDHNKYKVGRIADRNAVLLLLTGMGKANAASAAASLRSSYTGITLAIVTGICGGVPGVGTDKELLLGDVVISKCIVQYDLGRRYADRFAMKETVEDSLGRPHESVRSVLAVFETNSGRDHLQHRTNQILEDIQGKASHNKSIYQRPPTTDDRLFEPGYLHRHRGSEWCECSQLGACEAARQASCDELHCDTSLLLSRPRHRKRKFLDLVCNGTTAHELRVAVGRLGSGDTVMKSGLDRDHIAQEHNLIAFEMEGAGIWDRFPCIVVKAVCDYSDSHKNKKYQDFAAARAASATKAILEAFPSPDSPSQSKHVDNFNLLSATEALYDDEQTMKDKLKNRRNLLELLAADHETQKNFNPQKVPGTCEWFLRDQRYREWLESTASSIIWVSAGPGCGKSVLARALIDHGRLSTNPANTTICYFFFKDGYERRVKSHDAISSILHQLFTQDQKRSLISHADKPHEDYGASLRNNFHQLWEILVACASQPESREIVCVLDALDECSKEGRQDISQVLERFYFGQQNRGNSSKLKFLITSRPYDDLEMSFDRMATAESYIRLDGDDKSEEIRHEIDLVIDHKVNEFGKDFREEHRRAISERLKAMENRTYLWLHLTLSIIDEKRSAYRKPSSVQALLSRLPSSVFDAYEKILSRSQDEEQARILLNIILAATRPLTLDEVNWAFTLQAKNFMNHDELEDDVWPRETLKITVKNLCGLFVSVFDNNVSFIHQTAREFLTTTSGQPNTWKGTFDMSLAHGEIFLSCIRLFSMHDVDTMVDDAFDGRGLPFVTYAAQNWAVHYNLQNSGKRDIYCEAARELCRTTSGQAPEWAYLQRRQDNGGHVWNCTDLTFASYLGLLEVVEHIVEKENIDVDSEGGYFGTATEAAAAGGHLAVVQSLIRHGASRDVEGERFSSALEAAIIQEHLSVAKCLLADRGDPVAPEVIMAAVDSYDCEPVACLIQNARNVVEIREEVMIAAAANELGGDEIIAFFLNSCRYVIDAWITEELLETAARNRTCGDKIIALLLKRCGSEFDISGRLAEIAAGNDGCGDKIITLFLEEYGDRFIVTLAVVEEAVCEVKTMSLLLEKRGHEIEITPRVISRCGIEVLALLLEKRGHEVKIRQVLTMTAAKGRSKDMMKIFLENYEGQFELTTALIQAVARNAFEGPEIMAVLLDRYGGEGILTQETLITAAGWWCSDDSLAVLLRGGDGDVKVTEEVVVAAASNHHPGPMKFLLKKCRAEFEITQKVISAAKRGPCRMEMVDLLQKKHGDEVTSYDFC